MAINAYVGLQGSGKSYQVVAFPILEAVQKGRRVVTTIHGIETEKVRAYLAKKGRGQPGKMGEVIVVEEEEVQKPNFFPSRYIEVDGAKVVDDAETVVKGGDLVVLDEAWKFYGTGVKPTTEHFTFFREHRHYLHPETEVTCDLILLTQNIEDLCKSVRGVIEATFRTVKLKALGLNNRYRVEQYQGSRLTKAAKVDVTTGRSYDLEICALYQSHAGGVGNELAVDRRQNLLLRWDMWAGFFVVLAFGIWGLWYAYNYFTGGFLKKPDAAASKTVPANVAPLPGAPQPVAPRAVPSAPPFSSAWRIAGTMKLNEETFVVLTGQGGRVRLEHPSEFSFVAGRPSVGVVDGERVTAFSGNSQSGAASPLPRTN